MPVFGKDECPDKGYCLYAADYLLPLISSLSEEIEGVKYSDDIEYVHRCRVATRRLRAAMPVFEECFSSKDYKKWRNEIKQVTGSLGEARDADVQIDFLKRFLSSEDRDFEPVFFSLQEPGKGSVHTNSGTDIIPVHMEEEENEEGLSGIKAVISGIKSFFYGIFSSGDKTKDQNAGNSLKQSDTAYDFRTADPYSPGIECLITRLGQKRKKIQPEVIESMVSFENSGTVEKMGEFLREIRVQAGLEHTDIHSPYAFEKAFYNISLAMENLFWHEKYLPDPEKITRHHEMRISAKKFRYTLETYSGLYPGDLGDEIKVMKKLQDYLGDMHDCDVWAEFLDEFIIEEKKRTLAFFGNAKFFEFVLPGLLFLKENRISKRKALHSELVEYWEQLKKDNYWNDLKSVISIPLQSSFHHLIENPGEDNPLHIALIGDVHANLPALEAVLADAYERGATAVINTGDLVGYGAYPDQVVSKIRSEHIISVIGNYDLSVLKVKKKKKSLPKNRQKRFAMKWAYKELSADNINYLKSLPKYVSLNLKNSSIHITHGSPDSIKDYINEETPDEKLESYIRNTGAGFIITGHTHIPFAKKAGDTWFINTGSVGRPDDGDPRACYAMLSLNPFSLYHVRVPYDVEKAVEEIYRKNLPESFARIFREGRPLDIIMHSDGK